MDNKKNSQILKYTYLILKKLYLLIFLLIFYILILIMKKINIINIILIILKLLTPLFIGIVIAWLLKPIVNYLDNKKMNRLFAVITLYIIMIFFIYISVITFIPIFIKEFMEFINTIPILISDITDSIKFIKIDGLMNKMISKMNNQMMKIPLTCIGLIKDISTIVIGLIIGFYLLIEKQKLNINKYVKKDSYLFFIKINTILRNYVKGTLLSSFIVFIASTILFYILNLESALLLGFICGITNIIPFIGPYIGAVIPVLIAFTKNITFGILVIVVIFIIQTIEGNIIHPLIMKKSINVHPVISIISVLIFGCFFGIIGMIVAVPFIAILKELYFYLIKKNSLSKRRI